MDHVGHAGQAQSLEGRVRVGVGRVASGCAGGEAQVLPHGEVVVAEGLVTDERQLAAGAPAVDGQIVTQHGGFTGVQGNQPGQEPEQRGLPGAVRS